MLGIKVQNGQKAGNIGNAGSSSNAGYLIVQYNDKKYVQQQVDDVAGKCGEHGDTYMQCTGEPSCAVWKTSVSGIIQMSMR